jgi:hypothetical protein
VKKTPVKKATTPNGVAGIGGFSSFGAPKKAVKTPPRAAGTISVTKQARGPGTISISTPKKTPPPAPAQPKKNPPRGSGTFSIFGGSSAPSKPVTTPEPVKPKGGSGTFSIFGGPSAPSKPAATPEPVKPKAAAKSAGGFSLFGGAGSTKKAEPKVVVDNIPVVGKFKQNPDGSITGIVRNSKNFRNGTEITTSPVKRGAKAGDVVTTSSGSKYRLE